MCSHQKVNYQALVTGFFGTDFEVWSAYLPLTYPYWQRYPELLSAGFYLAIQEPLTINVKLTLKNTLSETLHFIKHAQPVDFSKVPPCAAMLFRSSIKPSTDSVFLLAEELAKSGIECATVLTSNTLTIWQGDSRQEVSGYADWMKRGLNRSQALRTILRTVWLCLLLTFLSLMKNRVVLKRLYRNPLAMWTTLLMASHRLQVFHHLLTQMQPGLILVNNERVPVAAELMLAKSEVPVKRVLFCNELPSIMLDPVIADEVWVWNEVMAEQIETVIRHGQMPDFQIVGHSEIELALDNHQDDVPKIQPLQQAIGTKPTLLFLSEYIPSKVFDFAAPTRIAFEWMNAAAHHHPDWCFIIKTRPRQARLKIPGIEIFDGQPNVFVSEVLSLKDLLQWENIKIIAALGSTGLGTGAGVGKTALRFWTPPRYGEVGVIDTISLPIRSGQDLIQYLADFAHYHPDESLFPYRGKTVQRMKHLCLQHLDNKEM